MATYFPTSNNQSNVAPLLYSRDSFSCTETPIYSGYMMMDISGSRNGKQDFSAWASDRNEIEFLPPMGGATGILQGMQNLQGEGLSLSLSTQIPSAFELPSIEYGNPSLCFSSSEENGNASNKHLINLDPMKVDNGMLGIARTITSSKYLKVAQQLLDEVVHLRIAVKQKEREKDALKSLREYAGESNSETTLPTANGSNSTRELSATGKQDLEIKLTNLLSLLDEVDRRYKIYYQQMQIVVSSLDALCGSGAANRYTSLALQTISRHFRCLRDAITGQIRATRRSLGEVEEDGSGKNYSSGVGISRLRYLDQHLRQQRGVHQLGMMQQHSWRPQRGLPESSVSVLRAWLFEHFLDPYPKDSEKITLARQAGLTRNQVSNWFINARVRLWKPMVEDMYKEEVGDVEIDSISSSEVAPKATKSDKTTPEGIWECIQQNATSKQIEQFSRSGIQRGGETEYGLLKSRGGQRSSVDESSLLQYIEPVGGSGRFPATAAVYHPILELGRF